ncbi:MAG: hypothetical protein K2M78_16930 [Lachnospiraceae bacterium]|nr:hypothetical protein [Lachnospiraceae bacterium]
MYNNDNFDFNDEPVDLTSPGRSTQAQQNYAQYENKIKRTTDPFIMKFTGILVIIAMVGALVFLFYLISLGAFDIDKNISLLKNAGIAIYGVFLFDAIVMTVLNKRFSILVIALIFPLFYPLKRSYVTYNRKSIQALWLAAFFILTGFVLNNLYPQLYDKVQVMKTSRDEYTSECNDAVKYLKGVKVESGNMIIEVIKDNVDDYIWKAEKNADGSYIITVKGDTELEVDGVFRADEMIKNNTSITFSVNASMDNYLVSGLKVNDIDYISYANIVWSEMCKSK